MKGVKIFGGVLQIFLVMPIWYYLIYSILRATNADRLVWFLFWVYLPVGLVCRLIEEIAMRVEKT